MGLTTVYLRARRATVRLRGPYVYGVLIPRDPRSLSKTKKSGGRISLHQKSYMFKRVIIKIGTSVLTNAAGSVDEPVLERLVGEIALLKKGGIEVIMVTSGAVGFGREVMQSENFSRHTEHTKVLAAVGQVRLMSTYVRLFDAQSITCAQVLVTKDDFRDRDHYHTMRETFLHLLDDKVMPIVNENDVIAHKDVSFTDNDELAGLIAAQLEADAMIILSSVEGVLSGDIHDSSTHAISRIDPTNIDSYQKFISNKKTAAGRGGMVTKFAVARRLMVCGITVYIANGKRQGIVQSILRGDAVGTRFVPADKINSVKRRLAYADGFAMGTIVINERAAELLSTKKQAMSILPVGIVIVEGDFKKGDIVEIR